MITIHSESGLTAKINPKGAELVSLQNTAGKEFIWEGNPDFWGKHSPVLFPIVGTLKNNSYHIDNQTYSLSRHGFARDMEFEVVNKSGDRAVFSLSSSEETLKNYPFHFEFRLTYTLSGNKLDIRYNVINKNGFPMPFSLGAHPAFALPGNFEEYALAFDKDDSLHSFLLENDLLSAKSEKIELQNQRLPLSYRLFENDALIFKSLQSRKLALHKNKIPQLSIRFDDFPNLGLWTKPGAPFICIEPWFGYSDTSDSDGNLFHKEGIRILEADSVFECGFDIEIS